jgi:AcrR family transcriptional regulator
MQGSSVNGVKVVAIDKNVNKKNAAVSESSPSAVAPATVAPAAGGRRRRSPAAARDNILEAAEAILTESGPQNLKLTEVARAAGVSAATVLHHFTSIDGVQTALMERMITNLVARIVAITQSSDDHILSTEADAALFDAFEAAGAARLAAWLVMTGEATRLDLVRRAVGQVVDLITAHLPQAPEREVLEDLLLASITAALGSGLFGGPLSALLGRPADTARRTIMAALTAHFATMGVG